MKVTETIALAFGVAVAVAVAAGEHAQRQLFELIEDYEPQSPVTDHAAIDLDFRLIKHTLSKAHDSSFRVAERVYQEGAFSRSIAELLLDSPLTQTIPKGTDVVGTAYGPEYSVVKGTTQDHYSEGAEVLKVVYEVSENQHCQVGANPEPNTGGCFTETGKVQVPDLNIELDYTYDISVGNLNYRSFQTFSLHARRLLNDCENCPKPHYKKFVDYYGKYGYADHIISSALKGEMTDMAIGNAELQSYDESGLAEFIQKSLVWMTLWMEVISRLERSIDACQLGTEADDDEAVLLWDSGVAFYTGSRVSHGKGGDMLFGGANSRCRAASTCGENGDEAEGTALVNYKVLKNFQGGQNEIRDQKCEQARATKEEIARLMTIPLVQGTMHFAHYLSEEDDDDGIEHASEGAAFAMSILPLVHACSAVDAQIIYDNMKVSTDASGDFVVVQDALRRNYGCLRVTCEEIGSIVDRTSGELLSCMSTTSGQAKQASTESGDFGAFFLYSFALLAGCAIVYIWMKRIIARQREEAEKHLSFDIPAPCPLPDAIDSIVDSADYVPKYWKDTQKTSYDDTPMYTIDDNIMGEML